MAEKGKPIDKTPEEEKGSLLSSIRLSRAKAIEITALGLVLIIGILLRILPLRWGEYLNEYDPFFFYRVAEYVAKNGYAAYFTWHDTLSWYPMGRDIAHSSYLGDPFSVVFIWLILNSIGLKVALLDVTMFFPVLMATFTCIGVFYLAKDFGGKTVGIFAALLATISPSYIVRTVVGFFDTENIGMFGIIVTPLMFLRSTEAEKPLRTRILYALGGGLVMGYTLVSWGAGRYVPGMLVLYMTVLLILGKLEMRHAIGYTITIAIGFLIALITPRLGMSYLMNIDSLGEIGFVGLLVIYEIVKTRLHESQARLVTIGIVVIAIVAFIALPYVGIGNPIVGKFAKVLNPFADASSLYTSVSENRISAWSSFFQDFGVTMILAVVGVYFCLKDGGENKIYAIIFFLTAVYFAGTLVRLTLLLAFPVSLMAAYALVKLLTPMRAITLKTDDSRSKRKRAQAMGMNKGVAVIFIVILLGAFVPHVLNVANTASSPGPLAESGVPVIINGDYPKDWVNALNWIKTNTTQGSIICSWWDYGYWIETMANRTTLNDGSTQNRTQIIQVARIMMEPENSSLKILKRYNVNYVVVFVTFNPNTPTEEWPFGDNVKWPQMASIAGYTLSDYYRYNQTSGQYYYTQAFGNTTIYKLMSSTPDPNHFTRVYKSTLGWVLIYKVTY